MVSGVRSVVQLCWTISLILPLVRCQLEGDRFGGNGSGNGTRATSKSSYVSTDPFQDGGFVGELSKSQSNPSQTTRPSEANQVQEQRVKEVDSSNSNDKQQLPAGGQLTPLVPSSTLRFIFATPPAVLGAADGVNSILPVASSQSTSLNAWDTWAPSPTFLNGVSSTAVGNTFTPVPTLGNIEATTSKISFVASSTFAPSAHLTPLVPSSSTAAPATATPSTSTLATQSQTTPSQPSPTSPEQNQNQSPIPTAAESQPMSAAAKAGVGVGVTFVILSIAGGVGFFLYRRRRNRRHENTDFPKPRASVRSSSGFNLLHRGTSHTDASDQEWSIESAEKVEIVCVANARSFSRNSVREIMNERPNSSLGVMKVGMTIDNPDPEAQARLDRAKNRYTAALTSNPPSPPHDSALKTSEALNTKPKKEDTGADAKTGKTGSWPLAE